MHTYVGEKCVYICKDWFLLLQANLIFMQTLTPLPSPRAYWKNIIGINKTIKLSKEN